MTNPAAEVRAKVQAAHPGATVVGRTHNGIKHQFAPNKFVLDVGIGPLHYGPSFDQEIDTDFVPSTAPWDWEMTKAAFEIRALSDLSSGQVIEYRDKESGEWVRFQPMALQYSNDLGQIQQISMPQSVQAQVSDDTLVWAAGYGSGRDFSWQAQTARLAKKLTIQSLSDLPAVEQYILDGGNPVLELSLIFAYSNGVTPYINGVAWTGNNRPDRDTQGTVGFKDGQGNTLWWFNLPRSWDSSADPESGQQLGTFQFKKQGNSLYISHRVPLSFVQSAVYPLMVDVTVDEDVGASEDDAHEPGFGSPQYTLTNDLIYASVDPVSANYNCMGARWQTVDVPQGATIDVAYQEIYIAHPSVDDPNMVIYGNKVTSAVNFATDTNIISRVRTSAGASWVDIGIGVGFQGSSIDISAVIEELVGQGSWSANNNLVLTYIANTNNENRAISLSYDNDPSNAPKLHIEYTIPGNITVTPPTLSLALTLFPPTIKVGITVEPLTLDLAFTLYAPTVILTAYVAYGAPFFYTAANWGSSLEFFLEIYFKATTGTIGARLFNATDATVVADSVLTTTSTSYIRLRSGALSLTDGKSYFVQFSPVGVASGAFKSAKIIAI